MECLATEIFYNNVLRYYILFQQHYSHKFLRQYTHNSKISFGCLVNKPPFKFKISYGTTGTRLLQFIGIH